MIKNVVSIVLVFALWMGAWHLVEVAHPEWFNNAMNNRMTEDNILPDGRILIEDFDNDTVVALLALTSEVKDYHILINSGGGNAPNTVTMVNHIEYLQSQGAHITTEILGYGLSAGAVLFMAGDKRIVHEGAMLMFHGCAYNSYGGRQNANKMLEQGQYAGYDFLSMIDDVFKRLLYEKTELSLKEIEDWMYFDEANFMSAEEAFEINVATDYEYR